ncbi:MAG TPA: hypothetical protein VFM54_19000 [Micromonosporaceae bacterium]|nr:hypothetical protein [Micromonosporaceae bacterium]
MVCNRDQISGDAAFRGDQFGRGSGAVLVLAAVGLAQWWNRPRPLPAASRSGDGR